jgi:hypothetical protein
LYAICILTTAKDGLPVQACILANYLRWTRINEVMHII